VVLHRIAAALDLGDLAYVAENGPRIAAPRMPVERRVSKNIDVARAHSLLGQDEDAITTLLTAEQEAPQLVRHNPAVRETVRAIHRRAPVTMGGRESQVVAFAERCRAIE
jgi:hypothetical protein